MTKGRFFSCDFETTTESFYKKFGYTRVWAAGACDISDLSISFVGNSLDDFMRWAFSTEKYVTKTLYFHNLQFDGSFIVPWLLNNGFKFVEKLNDEANTFTTLISRLGVWYSIEIQFVNSKNRLCKLRIYDSLKKLPYSVEEISKSWETRVKKLNIDYDIERDENYQLNDNEKEYLINDILIIAEALQYQINNGDTKMTIASDTLSHYRQHYINKFDFERSFPPLSPNTDKYMRPAYRGGFVYLNPKFKEIELKNVTSFDCNSMYPDKMRNFPMPYGTPKFFEGQYKFDNLYPTYIQNFSCRFELKENGIPFIAANNLKFNNEYLTSSNNKILNLTLSEPDFKLFLENYNVYNIKYYNGIKFKTTKRLFRRFIDDLYQIKLTETGAKKANAKLKLNALYGKFAKRLEFQQKIPYLDENGVLRFYTSEIEFLDGLYLPVSIFTTAYARYQLINAIKNNYENFVYCDTDSIHLLTPNAKGIEIDSKKLGAWKNEGTAEQAIYLRAKCYAKKNVRTPNGELKQINATEENQTTIITCAGMPEKVKNNIIFDDFKIGLMVDGKLQRKNVKGGVILVNTTYTINSK